MSSFLTSVCVLLGVTSLRAELTSVTANLRNQQNNEGFKIENKSLNFVNLIKTNLRRNNDDYIAVDLRGSTLGSVVRGYESETRRLLNDTEESAPVLDLPAVAEKSADTESTAFSNVRIDQIPRNSPDMPVPRSNKNKHNEKGSMRISPNKDKDNKSRVDDWKRLVDKNKRLRMYTSTPKIEPSPSVTVRVITARHTPVGARNRKENKAARRKPKSLNSIVPVHTTGGKRAPPNADQLDMAPARGAYIHDLRMKGLFCHRNVLWPEGPKYDSKGNVLMPAFNPSKLGARKTFVETTTALFILPRCCNCCKKSVLGCQ